MVKRIMGLILTGTMIMSLPACGKANTDTSKTMMTIYGFMKNCRIWQSGEHSRIMLLQ